MTNYKRTTIIQIVSGFVLVSSFVISQVGWQEYFQWVELALAVIGLSTVYEAAKKIFFKTN